MATLKQIEASRQNGSLSRGPVTPGGKARSAANAVKHGLYSNTVVLRNESGGLYEEMTAQYLAECGPQSTRERDLVIQIVNANWRLARIASLETATLDLEMDRQRPTVDRNSAAIDEPTRTAMAFNHLADSGSALALYGRTEARLRRTIERAEAQLNLLQAKRKNKKLRIEPEPFAA